VNYVDNLSFYLANRIIDNKDDIASALKDNSGDIVVNALSAKINDNTYACILSNINRSIDMIKSMDTEPGDFIEVFNCDEFGVTLVKYAIKNGIICGDFVDSFLKPVLGHCQDDIYDIIVLNVQQAVYRDYRKFIRNKAGENND